MAEWRAVATDTVPGWDWGIERRILNEAGAELVIHQCRTQEEVAAAMRTADVAFSQLNVPISAAALDAAARLRAIIVCATGYDHVDLAAAAERGIAVANVHGYCTEEVSDHALTLLLAVSRKILPLALQVRQGGWDFQAVRPVHRYHGRTLGLYGFGQIARRLAVKARPLGLRILALDPYVSPAEMSALGVESARDLAHLLAEAHYLSLHAPLTPENAAIINARTLAQMQPGAYLINCSRGGLVDELALYEALRGGHLAGAALDVTVQEPIQPDHPLLSLENVIITPHAAWLSEEAEAELSTRAASAAAAALRGELPPSTVNAQDLTKFWWVKNR